MIFFGLMVLGFTLGVLGSFLLFRRESMVGDAIAHAHLPGIAATFLIFKTKSVFYLLLGGNVSGILGLLFLSFSTKVTKLKKETLLGILLSVFFGIGLLLITIIQKKNMTDQAIINKLLFGSAATLLTHEIYTIIGICFVILFLLFLFFRFLITATFDPIFVQNCGYSLVMYEIIFFSLLVPLIALSLQVAGVILTSSMLIAPGAAARQWVHTTYSCLILAGFFGAVSAIVGTYCSTYFNYAPTGPLIIMVSSFLVVFSLTYAPKRGLL